MPDWFASRRMHQLSGSQRLRQPDADVYHREDISVAVNVRVDQAQGDSMRVRRGDQVRAMPACFYGSHRYVAHVSADLGKRCSAMRKKWRR
jgi:hypothetical protein